MNEKWAIYKQHEEFKTRELNRICYGCTDDSTFEEFKTYPSEAEARKAWDDGYTVSEVMIRQNISEVIEYFLVKVILDEDGEESEWQIEDVSNINLSAWAEYRNTKTDKTESVEQSGFTSYTEAEEWLNAQFFAHDDEEWIELTSAIR